MGSADCSKEEYPNGVACAQTSTLREQRKRTILLYFQTSIPETIRVDRIVVCPTQHLQISPSASESEKKLEEQKTPQKLAAQRLTSEPQKKQGLLHCSTTSLRKVRETVNEDPLQRSLELEKLLMPEFYSSPLGEEEQKRLFWDVWFRERKIFCWVDIERLFQNAQTWDEIISHRMVSVDWGSED